MPPADVDRIVTNIRARLDELGDIQKEIRLLEAAIAALDSIDDGSGRSTPRVSARPRTAPPPEPAAAPRGRSRAPRGQNWHRISSYLDEVRRPAGAKELSESTGIALATMYATLSKGTSDGQLRKTDEGYALAEQAAPAPAAEPPADPIAPPAPELELPAEPEPEPEVPAEPKPEPEVPAEPAAADAAPPVPGAAPIKERLEEKVTTRSRRKSGGQTVSPRRSRRASGMKAAALAVIDSSPGIGAAAISERTGANVVALEIVLDKAVENGELLAIDDGYALPSAG